MLACKKHLPFPEASETHNRRPHKQSQHAVRIWSASARRVRMWATVRCELFSLFSIPPAPGTQLIQAQVPAAAP